MTAQTHSAKDTARAVSKATGRKVDAKRVRQWVRDNVPAFDDDGYTSHQYDARTFARIVKDMTTGATSGRSDAASKGRTVKPASKPATRKPASKPGPVARVTPDAVTAEATTPTVSKA